MDEAENSGRHAHTIIVFQNQVYSMYESIRKSSLSAYWEGKTENIHFLHSKLTYSFRLWISKQTYIFPTREQTYLYELMKRNTNIHIYKSKCSFKHAHRSKRACTN